MLRLEKTTIRYVFVNYFLLHYIVFTVIVVTVGPDPSLGHTC